MRNILNPWIQFIRNIPPLAYVPLIVIVAGVGRRPQIIVITIACFLTMCVTIYQGVVNVDALRPPGYLGPAIKISLFGSSRQPLSPSSSLPYGWVLPWP